MECVSGAQRLVLLLPTDVDPYVRVVVGQAEEHGAVVRQALTARLEVRAVVGGHVEWRPRPGGASPARS